MQHIIKKQVIELKLKSDRDAFRMQHLISEHYRNEVINLLETIFDNYCSEEEVLLLDKVEIDFGVISEADLEKGRWDENILANFKANLLEQLDTLIKNKTSVKQSKSSNTCRQWIFYMQHGYLNWNTLVINDQWYNTVLQMLATDYSSVTALREIIIHNKKVAYRIAWQHDTTFLTKLIAILTAQNQKLLPKVLEEIYSVISLVSQHKYGELSATVAIKALWQQVILIAATEHNHLTAESITAMLLEVYADELLVQKRKQQHLLATVNTIKNPLIALFAKQADQNKNQPRTAEEWKANKIKRDADVKQTEDQQLSENTASTNAKNEGHTSKQNIEKKASARDTKKDVEPEQKENLKKIAKKKSEDEQNNKNKKDNADEKEALKPGLKIKDSHDEVVQPLPVNENWVENLLSEKGEEKEETVLHITLLNEIIPEEGIFIPNAGIVLTHPFIASLFSRLQWIEDNRFINTDAQEKAVFMLHYLATGSSIAEEYQLILCKLMCAYPADESLPAEMIFTEAELTEANDMLSAMIQQWSKLQNTSIAGLQEGFLQRSGKLFIRNEMPHVQVESSAIDILLDYLPWSLSIIKLPWMKEILRVEWR
jgi:hypothetical protein